MLHPEYQEVSNGNSLPSSDAKTSSLQLWSKVKACISPGTSTRAEQKHYFASELCKLTQRYAGCWVGGNLLNMAGSMINVQVEIDSVSGTFKIKYWRSFSLHKKWIEVKEVYSKPVPKSSSISRNDQLGIEVWIKEAVLIRCFPTSSIKPQTRMSCESFLKQFHVIYVT